MMRELVNAYIAPQVPDRARGARRYGVVAVGVDVLVRKPSAIGRSAGAGGWVSRTRRAARGEALPLEKCVG